MCVWGERDYVAPGAACRATDGRVCQRGRLGVWLGSCTKGGLLGGCCAAASVMLMCWKVAADAARDPLHSHCLAGKIALASAAGTVTDSSDVPMPVSSRPRYGWPYIEWEGVRLQRIAVQEDLLLKRFFLPYAYLNVHVANIRIQ